MNFSAYSPTWSQWLTVAAFTVLSGCLAAIRATGEVTLISPVRQPAAIVTGIEATDPERFAAAELARYLEKLTGVSIPVVKDTGMPEEGLLIAVGANQLTTGYELEMLGAEEFIIDVRPDLIVIAGGRQPPLAVDADRVTWYLPEGGALKRNRGTLYGVYDFLHHLGVRWYRPEPWGEHVPRKDEIKLPAGRRQYAPPFRLRSGISYYGDLSQPGGSETDTVREGTLWAVRNHLNAGRGGPHLGGNVEIRGGGHAYRHLVPVGRYFESNPEYFALIDGKRSDARPHQLCLANPDVQKMVADKIAARARANPHLEHLSLAPNDGDGHCQCEACSSWDDPDLLEVYGTVSNSNRVFRFAGIIAELVDEQLKEIDTGQRIFMYAYRDHMEAPTLLAEIHPNIAVMMAAYTGNSDLSRRLHDPDSYSRGTRGNSRFLQHLNRWLELVPPERFSIYEYFDGYRWPGPYPIVNMTIADRIRAYRQKGLDGVHTHSTCHWGPQGLNYYIYARLLWNPDLDLESELDLYYRNYYGPAAGVMKNYHESLEQAMRDFDGWIVSGGSGAINLFTPELIATLDPLIAEASRLTAGHELYAKRLHGMIKGHQLVVRLQEIKKLAEAGDLDAARQAGDELMQLAERNAGTVFAPGYGRLERQIATQLE